MRIGSKGIIIIITIQLSLTIRRRIHHWGDKRHHHWGDKRHHIIRVIITSSSQSSSSSSSSSPSTDRPTNRPVQENPTSGPIPFLVTNKLSSKQANKHFPDIGTIVVYYFQRSPHEDEGDYDHILRISYLVLDSNPGGK